MRYIILHDDGIRVRSKSKRPEGVCRSKVKHERVREVGREAKVAGSLG